MSTPLHERRRQVQRFGLAGIGTAVLFVGIASPAAAATDVLIPLQPTEVGLGVVPVENDGAMDPMADPNAAPVITPVDVRYGGTIAVTLPDDLSSSDVQAELVFDDNGDGTPEALYSSSFTPTNPKFLAITGRGTGVVTVTLPADDPIAGDAATLVLEPLTDTLGPALTYYDPVYYELGFAAAAPAAQAVEPTLVAFSQVPCNISSGTRCAFPTPVTAGSAVTLDLTAGSALRELGLTDLTGVELGLATLDADGLPTGAAVALPVQVTGSTASFVLPAGTAPGQYGLVVAQEAASGTVSVVYVELTVVPAAAPVVAPPAAPPAAAPTTPAPATQAVTANTGLRSNTGVTAPAEEGNTAAIAGGVGLLVLAGAGGIAATRTRRRPAVQSGTGEA